MACSQAPSAFGDSAPAFRGACPALLSPLVTALLATIPGLVQAQTPDPIARQTVTTVASREPVAAARQVADVVVITREDLQALPVDNLADALQRVAGVQVSRTGGPGQPTSVLMRGGSASGTLVVVDGVRVGSASLGQFDFATLGLAGIQRIEVLRGPGATVHGADAVSGVVLVTTRSATAPAGASAQLSLGSLGGQETAVRARRVGPDWDAQIAASREAVRGDSAVRPGDRFGLHNPDADGFQRQSLQLGGGWRPAPGHRVEGQLMTSRLFSRYDSAVYPPPTFAPDPSPDFATRTRTETGHLRYSGSAGEQWTWQAHLGRGEEDSRSGATRLERYLTTREQAGLQVSWQPTTAHRWTLAWDLLDESVQASGYARGATRGNDAWVLSYGGQFGALQVQADARQDRNSVYGTHETGRTGLRWALTPQTSLRLQAATTFRAPSFNELYFPGFGVPTLQPEEGRSLEAGLLHRAGGLRWEATAWRQSVRNLIAYSSDRRRCPPDASFNFGCAANFGEAELKGLTVELTQGPGLGTGLGTGTGMPLTWRVGYDLTDARDGQGQTLARRARHQLRASAEWTVSGWRLGPSWLWQSQRLESGVALRGRSRLDLQATRPMGAGWTLQARLLNALDADLEPARDYRAPGRQAWLGLRWEG